MKLFGWQTQITQLIDWHTVCVVVWCFNNMSVYMYTPTYCWNITASITRELCKPWRVTYFISFYLGEKLQNYCTILVCKSLAYTYVLLYWKRAMDLEVTLGETKKCHVLLIWVTRGDQKVLQLDTLSNKLIFLIVVWTNTVLYHVMCTDKMIKPFVVMTSSRHNNYYCLILCRKYVYYCMTP